jgi:hypothetical protein
LNKVRWLSLTANLSSAGVLVPRFFFDTYDGNFFAPDHERQELADIEAASLVAQEALPDMASDKLPDGDQRVFIVRVRDEAGQVVVQVSLTLLAEYPSQAKE